MIDKTTSRDIHENDYEQDRLQVLRSYQILDSARESRFDDLTVTTAELLDVPYAKIGFIDEDRVWYKSSYGLHATEGDLDGTVAKVVLANPKEITVIKNLATDPRVKHSSALDQDPDIKSAACVPITNSEGYTLGMLCVFDTKEREFSGEEIVALTRVARQIIELMDGRREAEALQETLRIQQEELRLKSTADRIARSLVNTVQTKESLHLVINKFIQSVINEFSWWGGQAWYEEEQELTSMNWVFSTSAPSSFLGLNKQTSLSIPNFLNEDLKLDMYSASDATLHDLKDMDWHPLHQKLATAGARNFVQIDVTGPAKLAMRLIFIVPTTRSFSSNAKKVLGTLQGMLPQVVRRARGAEELAYRATHDPLTGLLNRRGIEELYPVTSQLSPSQIDHVVFFFDLDKFKDINDQFGHAVGDEFLIEISKRLIESSRPVDAIARIGGDEFLIIAQGFDSEEALTTAANRFLDNLSRPFTTLDKINLHPRISLGISQWRKYELLSDAISHADSRMYDAKSKGGQQAVIDFPSASIRTESSAAVVTELPGLSIQQFVNSVNSETGGFFITLTPPIYYAPRIMQDAAQHIAKVITSSVGEKGRALSLIIETPGFKRADRTNLEALFDALISLHNFSDISYCFDTRTGNLDSSNFARELCAGGVIKVALGNFGAGNNEIRLIQELSPTFLLACRSLVLDTQGENKVTIQLLSAISKVVVTPLIIFQHTHDTYMPILSQSAGCMVIQDKELGKELI